MPDSRPVPAARETTGSLLALQAVRVDEDELFHHVREPRCVVNGDLAAHRMSGKYDAWQSERLAEGPKRVGEARHVVHSVRLVGEPQPGRSIAIARRSGGKTRRSLSQSAADPAHPWTMRSAGAPSRACPVSRKWIRTPFACTKRDTRELYTGVRGIVECVDKGFILHAAERTRSGRTEVHFCRPPRERGDLCHRGAPRDSVLLRSRGRRAEGPARSSSVRRPRLVSSSPIDGPWTVHR